MKQRPTPKATDAAIDAFLDTSPSNDVRARVSVALDAAYEVDGRPPASKSMEVALAVCFAATWLAFLVNLTLWIWS